MYLTVIIYFYIHISVSVFEKKNGNVYSVKNKLVLDMQNMTVLKC